MRPPTKNPRRGRPKLPSSEKPVSITFDVPAHIRDFLDQAAKRDCRSRAQYLRRIIEAHYKAETDGHEV